MCVCASCTFKALTSHFPVEEEGETKNLESQNKVYSEISNALKRNVL